MHVIQEDVREPAPPDGTAAAPVPETTPAAPHDTAAHASDGASAADAAAATHGTAPDTGSENQDGLKATSQAASSEGGPGGADSANAEHGLTAQQVSCLLSAFWPLPSGYW